MRKFIVSLLLVLVPCTAVAAPDITRREGFLLLWESIRRPALATREAPFADVTSSDPGFLEITYAKNRGLIDDEESAFRPNAPLTRDDALLWLFRTRNIDDLDSMERDDLPALLQRYPIAKSADHAVLSRDQLVELMRSLDTRLQQEDHEISLYGEKFHGAGTAFGETFDMNALTAAHRTFPQNTLVRVTNVENEKSVVVRINDRGPYVEGRDMDLSLAAFTTIADRSRGVIRARFERLGDATLAQSCGDRPAIYQQRLTRDVRFQRGVPHTLPHGNTLTLKANKSFVVRSITYPDGNMVRLQDYVQPEEDFSFTPSVPGVYVFRFGTVQGRQRTMQMEVIDCAVQS